MIKRTDPSNDKNILKYLKSIIVEIKFTKKKKKKIEAEEGGGENYVKNIWWVGELMRRNTMQSAHC